MSEQFYTILTQIGKASIVNASALGTKVEFRSFALGDGNGSYYNPTETQVALKNEVWKGQIGQVVIDEENPNWIVLETIIPANIGGFTIREAGVFDLDGNLLAVGKYPETYKPVLADGSSKDLYIRMILEVANTSVVTLKVDPSIILASKKDLDVLSNRITKNENDILDLKKGSSSIEGLETDNKTIKGAINELKAKDDSLDVRITKNKDDIAGLNTDLTNYKEEVNTQMADKANEIDEARNTTAKYVTGAINELNNKKVEKITGKSLSTNDYTDSEKQKNEDNKNNISDLAGVGRTTETVKKNSDDITKLDAELRSHTDTYATIEQKGHVQLNNTLTSTSSLQALTAAKGKELKDLLDNKDEYILSASYLFN